VIINQAGQFTRAARLFRRELLWREEKHAFGFVWAESELNYRFRVEQSLAEFGREQRERESV